MELEIITLSEISQTEETWHVNLEENMQVLDLVSKLKELPAEASKVTA
jgi:hypothetical protein